MYVVYYVPPWLGSKSQTLSSMTQNCRKAQNEQNVSCGSETVKPLARGSLLSSAPHLINFLGSLYRKQNGPRSDCSF